MQSLKRYILIFVGLVVFALGARAEQMDGSQLRISLITCTPGVDAYSHFGHTALHVIDEAKRRDMVFNYGCFNYKEQNFVMNFIKGDTNYKLDVEDGEFFMFRYSQDGHGVVEQVLNLTDEEKVKLFKLLLLNVRPENQTYLYNWLYDNCTERARDVIEEAVDGKVEYRRRMEPITAREMLHECLWNAGWLRFGIDLLLGTEIDEELDRRVQMFIPSHYEAEADEAVIVDRDGRERPLIEKKIQVFEEKERPTNDFIISPELVMLVLLAVALGLQIYDRKRKKVSVWFDVCLLTVQGLAGCIVAFLYFFSKHPAVDSNWWVLALNPLALVYAPWMVWCYVKRKRDWGAWVYCAMMIGFIVATVFSGQNFGYAGNFVIAMFIVRGAARGENNLLNHN